MKDQNWGRPQDKFGKAITYHYFINNDKDSLCGLYKKGETSTYVNHPTKDILIKKCKSCKKFLQSYLNTGIKKVDTIEQSHENFLDKIITSQSLSKFKITDKYHQIQTICPECKTNVCFYSDGISKDHYCTVCSTLVDLQLETIPA